MSFLRNIFGYKINGTRVTPVTLKITLIFTLIILVSNLTSNYINLMLNRTELNNLLRQLLVKDLRDMNTFCNNQFEIYQFNKDEQSSIEAIENKGLYELRSRKKGILLAIKDDGSILFQAIPYGIKLNQFGDANSLKKITQEPREGYIEIDLAGIKFLSVYKYNKNWDATILLAEEEHEFYSRQRIIYTIISFLIVLITLASAAVGIYLFRDVLRFIQVITTSIMRMIQNQKLELIDLRSAPNDDITYMGMAFNSLSSSVDTLINIFRKFTNKDVVSKAYREHQVSLGGVQKELAILFSDIKSFTMITETLGMDIIKLLNLHYDRAIRKIQEHDGLIAAIIGDALLAIYGVMDEDDDGYDTINKSYQAVLSAYKVQEVARSLRKEMWRKKDEVVKRKGSLTPEERKIYRAVLIEVGVGIDGGMVFYGTIGSNIRMTNTVIGDRVNSASRLEGLTRIYRIPVICSEYVKNDIERNIINNELRFIEIDTVQVKGKSTGMKIYFPVPLENYSEKMDRETKRYSVGLDLYYRGDWVRAYEFFKGLRFKPARVFRERIRNAEAPHDWNGIWEMKTK